MHAYMQQHFLVQYRQYLIGASVSYIVDVNGNHVRTSVCLRPTARLRMHEIRIPHISKCLRHNYVIQGHLFLTHDLKISCMRAKSRRYAKKEATQAPKQPSRIPIPAFAKRGNGMAKTAFPIQPSYICVALLSRKKQTATWLIIYLYICIIIIQAIPTGVYNHALTIMQLLTLALAWIYMF